MRKALVFARLPFIILVGLLAGRLLYASIFFPLISTLFHILFMYAVFCMLRTVWSLWNYNSWERDQRVKLTSIANQEAETVKHLIIIAMYKEDIEVPYETLNHMKNYTTKFDFTICLATESRDDTAPAKVIELQKRFKGCFADIISTCHPDDPNETKGKGSNLNSAYQTLRLRNPKWDIFHILDVDTHHNEEYFKRIESIWLLSDTIERSKLFFTCPIAFKRNHNEVAWVVRFVDRFWSIGNLTSLYPNSNLIMPISTYSISFDLLEKMNGWDADAFGIGEDLHSAVKAYCKTHGDVSFQSIYVPATSLHVTRDRVGKETWFGDIHARYDQGCRHLWGLLTWSYYLEFLCENPSMLKKWSSWLVLSRIFEPISMLYVYFFAWVYLGNLKWILFGTWVNGSWMCICYFLKATLIYSKWGMKMTFGRILSEIILLAFFGPLLAAVYSLCPIINATFRHIFSVEFKNWVSGGKVKASSDDYVELIELKCHK